MPVSAWRLIRHSSLIKKRRASHGPTRAAPPTTPCRGRGRPGRGTSKGGSRDWLRSAGGGAVQSFPTPLSSPKSLPHLPLILLSPSGFCNNGVYARRRFCWGSPLSRAAVSGTDGVPLGAGHPAPSGQCAGLGGGGRTERLTRSRWHCRTTSVVLNSISLVPFFVIHGILQQSGPRNANALKNIQKNPSLAKSGDKGVSWDRTPFNPALGPRNAIRRQEWRRQDHSPRGRSGVCRTWPLSCPRGCIAES